MLRELVCYGIGNFSESDSSRYQLALALCLRDLLSTKSSASDVAAATAAATSAAAEAAASRLPGNGSTAVRGPAVLVFDPVMGETERAILETLGCGLLQNEEGKRCCCHDRRRRETSNEFGDGSSGSDGRESLTTPTLFFMPHCPQRLYSNVLWANWSSRGEWEGGSFLRTYTR